MATLAGTAPATRVGNPPAGTYLGKPIYWQPTAEPAMTFAKRYKVPKDTRQLCDPDNVLQFDFNEQTRLK